MELARLKLMAFALAFVAFITLIGVAFAEDYPRATVFPETIQEIDSTTEVVEQPISSTGDLDNQSPYEAWQGLAIFLPFLIGFITRFFKIAYTDATKRAQIAIVVYVIYSLAGEALKGTFETLGWYSPQAIVLSLIKVAMTGYTSYQIMSRVAPSLVNAHSPPKPD